MEHMSPAQFKTLISFIRTEVREVVTEEFKRQDYKFDRIYQQFDQMRKVTDKDELEIAAMSVQLDRHEERITRLEKKIA